MEPVIEAQMLIRKPIDVVFNAFIDPSVTIHFWFTKSSGRLEEGQSVVWTWEMYGAETTVLVKKIQPSELIVVEWGNPSTTIEFNFQSLSEDQTYVVIRNYGFQETGDELLAAIMDNTGGFTTVLDGMKAYLEHGIKLNLIGDKYPQNRVG